MPAVKQEQRGRSTWSSRTSRGRAEVQEDSRQGEQNVTQSRSSKRKKRSDLSPSSKATHSIIERERREAMNEKFAELAAQVPELVDALNSGKRPTKGEIVKASIARHQEQDRHIKEMQLELQALRASNTLQGITAEQGLAASMPQVSVETQQDYTLNYQIQPSRPILQSIKEEGSIWLGHLLGNANEHLPIDPALTYPSHLVAHHFSSPASPFKQSCIKTEWTFSGLKPYDPSSMDSSEMLALDHAAQSEVSSLSTFPSPAFTSSDTDSSFSSDPLDAGIDESTYLADSFEPFVLADTVEETPLAVLLELPSDQNDESGSAKVKNAATLSSTSSANKVKSEPKSPSRVA